MATIKLAGDELLTICNALNAEASDFDKLVDRHAGKTSMADPVDVWRRAAARNRALTVRLLEAAYPAARAA